MLVVFSLVNCCLETGHVKVVIKLTALAFCTDSHGCLEVDTDVLKDVGNGVKGGNDTAVVIFKTGLFLQVGFHKSVRVVDAIVECLEEVLVCIEWEHLEVANLIFQC